MIESDMIESAEMNRAVDEIVRILLVEDSALDAELVMLRLEQSDVNFQFLRVDNEKDYLAALRQPFDLILSDWSLPNFSGLRALTIRNDLKTDIPFIIISGSIGEESAVEAMRMGAVDYLLKDRPSRLSQAISNALNRKRIEQARKKAEEMVRLQSVALNAAANSIVITDHLGVIEWVNPSFSKLTGYSFKEALGRTPGELIKSGLQTESFYREFWQTIQAGEVWRGVLVNRRKDGCLYYQEQMITPLLDESGRVEKFIAIQQDITERREKELELEKQHARLALLYEAGKRLSQSLDLNSIYNQFYHLVKEVMDCDHLFIADYFEESQLITARFVISDGKPVDVGAFPPLSLEPEGHGLQNPAIRSGKACLVSDVFAAVNTVDSLYYFDADGQFDERDEAGVEHRKVRSLMVLPIHFQQKVRGVIQVQSYRLAAYDDEDLQIIQSLVAQIAVASNNAMLYEQSLKEIEFRKQVEASLLLMVQRQEKIAALARELATTLDIREIYRIAKQYLLQLSDTSVIAISYFDELGNLMAPAFLSVDGQELDPEKLALIEFQTMSVCTARSKAVATQSPTLVNDLSVLGETFGCAWDIPGHDLKSSVYVPMVVEGQVIGLIDLQSSHKNSYQEEDSEWLSVVANLIGMVYQNASLYTRTQHRMEELAALHAIDSAVISHTEIGDSFDMILEQIKDRLDVDAANILLFDPLKEQLNFFTGFGFLSEEISQTRLQLGEGLAGKCALEKRLIQVPNIDGDISAFANMNIWNKEGFVASYNLPLVVNSKLIGVLAVFKRTLIKLDRDWLLFFEVLASQIAIVIDYMNVIHDLQKANNDLLMAYDATIEGWSQAMDLRDHETEGHTQRVTELTLSLAETLGFNEELQVHIRRGALLHDIGKLGVPDNILLKEGPLTEDEWAFMKKHPVFAYQMLKPIDYLNPALDIPYYHHERWDGSGYPNGLAGEEIPPAARIFAIVDVWDALTSDRPYRKAWSREKTLAHIQAEAGKHFDPKIVDLFVQYIREHSEEEDLATN